MNSESEWLDANARYMSAAVAWIRASLQNRIAANPEPVVDTSTSASSTSASSTAPATSGLSTTSGTSTPSGLPPTSNLPATVPVTRAPKATARPRRGFFDRLRTAPPSAATRGLAAGKGLRAGEGQDIDVSETLERIEGPSILPPPAQELQRLADEMERIAREMTPPPALLVLSERLGLSPFEKNILLLCAAVELDTSIAGLCARAQDDPQRMYPTFALALDLLPDRLWDALSPQRPLRHWRLLEIGQPPATALTVSSLRIDEHIVNFLKGVTYLDDRLTPILTSLPDQDPETSESQATAAQLILEQLQAVAPERGAPVVQLLGTDPTSKHAVAALVCRTLHQRIYKLDSSVLPLASADLETLVRLWQRDSVLLPIALYVDAESVEGTSATIVDRLLSRVAGTVFLGTRNLWPGTSHAPIAVEVSKPTSIEQRACWVSALGAENEKIADSLAAQFNLGVGTIRDVAQRELASSRKAAPTDERLDERLWDACRTLTRPRVDNLARRLETRATWDDLVLPPQVLDLLHQIVGQVGQRSKVYRDWGFAARLSRGLGISVLFVGSPGTGKTTAAEVLARHLRLDLFRIDLSAVMSKYIGETEANLRRLFDAMEDGGGILFFDEADALFGRRTEVKDSLDRFSNIEINYLLQRMESYRGLAILATNMKSALDQAFLRRLRFVVDFEFPGTAERKLMWQKAFPSATPTQGLDFDRLARLNITGGHISVIALNATFQAARAGQPVTMPLVLNAARIEYRKLSRPINEPDFRWVEATR